MYGKVTLVGAGPGDRGLLTLKGCEAIKNADVVIYDRLVGEDILNLIPENAEKIDAGKKSSNHKIPQEKINGLLLDKAAEGKNVVRLKGGDCFMFGRGGEELELLSRYNVNFQVIPGITSALAVPAYAGIPITHRDFVSSVHIITGHQRKNEPLKINFKSCVECGGTLVFLMGVANIDQIVKGLVQNGMSKDMPCAVIENGTTPRQRKLIATIGTIEEKCVSKAVKSPAVIVVGQVCSLSNDFDWFDSLPLKGIRVMLTRPKDRAGTLSERLSLLGAEVIGCPCIETKSIIDSYDADKLIDKIRAYNWLVFTSPVGVKTVLNKLNKSRIDGRAFANVKIAVIGSATSAELEKYGLFADLMPQSYSGRALGYLLAEKARGEKVLLLRAKDGTADILEELKTAHITYEDMSVYETKYTVSAEITEKIISGNVDYVAFTSASTVKAFTASVNCNYSLFKGLCIGEKTNIEALKHGIKTVVSKNASIDDMIEALLKEVRECHWKQ